LTAAEIFRGRLVMAPMARGTDLPFRRLAAEWGAEVCFGEMAYAHRVLRRDRSEIALLRRHPSEKIFGAQLAGKHPQVVAEAARIAADMGSDFVDLNAGCPTEEVTRRGFGAALLERPGRVAALVSAIKEAVTVPVTVKLRLGWSDDKPTFLKIAKAAEGAGADAVVLHARSRAQRYRRPADWLRIRELAECVSIPVIGNGDILVWRDALRRLEEIGCAGVMVGRWALAKPWIFREFRARQDLLPSPEDRLTIVRRYIELCREAFGDDDKGRERTRRFLIFHQDFFRRYRHGAGLGAVNSEDPREWGEPPRDDLEAWLCRGDLPAVSALSRWLVDGCEPQPPPPPDPDAPRAVTAQSLG
jgi:tRNA-dihydrouridine synthase 3